MLVGIGVKGPNIRTLEGIEDWSAYDNLTISDKLRDVYLLVIESSLLWIKQYGDIAPIYLPVMDLLMGEKGKDKAQAVIVSQRWLGRASGHTLEDAIVTLARVLGIPIYVK